ncbi:MAG: tRNA (adenosine(37)-N6)-threonylcarbamoyltransferase complex ATPase subunit type 1 TsaE [bacterium]
MQKIKITTKSSDDTVELGYKFAKNLSRGDVVTFTGVLGAGKTEFIKGLCRYFNAEEQVSSPTFTIINYYSGFDEQSELEIAHIDLYRIEKPEELTQIGFDDYIYNVSTIKLIEWPDKAQDRLKKIDYSITIEIDDELVSERIIEIESF